jgi:hypothetical protein
VQFTVNSWMEIHRDPGGHYRHWSVALGTLEEGRLHLWDRVMFRARDGRRLASVLLGGHRGMRAIQFPLSAGDVAGQNLALAVWAPAYRVDMLAEHAPMTPCGDPTYRAINRELVLSGWPWCPCRDCRKALAPICGDEPTLWQSVSWLDHPHGHRPPTPR